MAISLDIKLPPGYQLNPADAYSAATSLADELAVTNAPSGLPTCQKGIKPPSATRSLATTI